jgi:hypothetical protein
LLIAILAWPPSYFVRVNDVGMSLTDGVFDIWDLVRFLLSLPFSAAFAAAWIRLIVLDDEAAMGRAPIAFDRRTWRVAFAFIRLLAPAFGVLLAGIAGLFLGFGSFRDGKLSFYIQPQFHGVQALLFLLVVLAALAVFAWFMFRFAMIIPAAATGDAPLGLIGSWRLTRPVQFRLPVAGALLFLSYCVVSLLLLVPMGFVVPILGVAGAFYAGLPMLFAIFIFSHALWAGLLGAAYRALRVAEGPEVAQVFD